MVSNPCRNCGNPTGDRHRLCWRCKRGVSSRLIPKEDRDVGYRCLCRNPTPQFIPIFGGYECGRCGYQIIERGGT
jgi:hypothetical protein